jgi:hypothetical protein
MQILIFTSTFEDAIKDSSGTKKVGFPDDRVNISLDIQMAEEI